MRAGSPETDQADPSDPRSPEVQAGRDVIPPKDERAGIVTTSDGPGGWGEGSGGAKPRKASTVGVSLAGTPATARTRHGNEALEAAAPVPPPSGGSGWSATSGGQGLREGYSSCARGTPWRAKPMDAPAPSAPGGPVVEVAKGVAKPRTWLAVTEGSVTSSSATAGLGVCRRARKPRRGSIAGRVGRWFPLGGAGDAAPRCGAAGTRLRRGTKAQGGPTSDLRVGARSGE
jgi:hypothetical protein